MTSRRKINKEAAPEEKETINLLDLQLPPQPSQGKSVGLPVSAEVQPSDRVHYRNV